MAKLNVGMLVNICFALIPTPPIIANIFAVRTYKQDKNHVIPKPYSKDKPIVDDHTGVKVHSVTGGFANPQINICEQFVLLNARLCYRNTTLW